MVGTAVVTAVGWVVGEVVEVCVGVAAVAAVGLTAGAVVIGATVLETRVVTVVAAAVVMEASAAACTAWDASEVPTFSPVAQDTVINNSRFHQAPARLFLLFVRRAPTNMRTSF